MHRKEVILWDIWSALPTDISGGAHCENPVGKEYNGDGKWCEKNGNCGRF